MALQQLYNDVSLMLRVHAGPSVSYQGEEVFPAETLAVSWALDGPCRIGAEATVDVLTVTEGRVHYKFQDPARMILRDEICETPLPCDPHVWASHEDWMKIARAMLCSGLFSAADEEAVARHR